MTSTAPSAPPAARPEPALCSRVAADRLARRPKALLLDFGGVIILTAKRPEGRAQFAEALRHRLAAAGLQLPAAQLEAALEAGATALKHWKHSSSRRLAPQELTVAEIMEFYFAELPDPARAVLTGEGAEVLDQMATVLTDHNIRPGARELITYAQQQGISLGIVSNAHSGRSHRRILADLGIHDAFGVQIYSDEAGIRKPHPDMLRRAAAALGADLTDCWYVGDTLDRDLVAGRRAGVGAVVLTRSQHTDEPPLPVHDTPEATVEDPAELLQLLQAATDYDDAPLASPAESPTPVPAATASPAASYLTLPKVQNQAVLLDHGGVVSHSVKPQAPFTAAAAALESVLSRAGTPVAPGRGLEIVQAAHEQYKVYKDSRDEDASYREITPRQYWGEFTEGLVSPRQRQALLAEAEQLQMALYGSKSVKTEREGTRELLQFCSQTARRVVVVSNTICGAGVRSIIRGYGLGEHIAGWVCSDEFGLKKPHPAIFTYALQMAGVAPEHAVMVGDKPFNDAYGAQQVGIGRRIITRGGSGEDAEIAQGLNAGWITDVVDHPGQIPALLR
ncbi:HAD family hydrolase [Nesterenkonia alkaliphila]|uniref:HAD-IA family hydrolase n=1 Tax=Nesterenkonia alkaliphila TaxID=1463631 RepID=A0A7K1UL26_9MICC|nr:HAD family hydrolase [Nesterenkonia alkaliphila]MVT27195.1 HAD-IA family hydrolase [Nesterenkonia alkaliphila]GFZ78665.1 haloacid dehalogenase [Nesterenkonia alkaliphila]